MGKCKCIVSATIDADHAKPMSNGILTSGNGERCEFVLGNGEAGVVVRRYSQVIPACGIQIHDHEVATGLNVV